MNSKKKTLVGMTLFSTLIFVITYTIVYSSTGKSGCDYVGHMQSMDILFANGWIAFLEENSYPLWEIAVALVMKILRAPITYAVAIATGVMNVMTYVLTYFFLKGDEDNGFYISMMSFLIMLVGPMYVPWYNVYIYGTDYT